MTPVLIGNTMPVFLRRSQLLALLLVTLLLLLPRALLSSPASVAAWVSASTPASTPVPVSEPCSLAFTSPGSSRLLLSLVLPLLLQAALIAFLWASLLVVVVESFRRSRLSWSGRRLPLLAAPPAPVERASRGQSGSWPLGAGMAGGRDVKRGVAGEHGEGEGEGEEYRGEGGGRGREGPARDAGEGPSTGGKMNTPLEAGEDTSAWGSRAGAGVFPRGGLAVEIV